MTDRPDIADKVRFWEEQDRINKELIPRVLKIHQLFTDHIEGHQDASAQIAAAEARLVERINKARSQAHGLLTDHIEGHQHATVQIAAAEARLVARISKARLQATAIAAASLVLAVTSIVLSVAL